MEYLIKMYLEYLNQFITIGAFADHYGLEDEDAETILKMGRKYHELKSENWINANSLTK